MLDKMMSAIGRFGYRFRYVICVVFVLIFGLAAYFQSSTNISYINPDNPSAVKDIFPEDDTLVIVYENADEGGVQAVLDGLSGNPHVTSVQCYANTLGLALSAEDLASATGLDPLLIRFVFYLYRQEQPSDLRLQPLLTFLTSEEVRGSDLFGSAADSSLSAMFEMLDDYAEIFQAAQTPLSVQEVVSLSSSILPEDKVSAVFGQQTQMTLHEFCGAIGETPLEWTSEQQAEIDEWQRVCTLAVEDKSYSATELASLAAEIIPLPQATLQGFAELLSAFYQGNTGGAEGMTLCIYDFFNFIIQQINTPGSPIRYVITPEQLAMLEENKQVLEDGKAQLVGSDYSRMIVTIDYNPDAKEITAFYDNLKASAEEAFEGEFYFVGATAMNYEISRDFMKEYTYISLIIAAAIFLIILLTFKKLSISAFLVLLIECAVFVSMSVFHFLDMSIYFIALIIVQSILMGSTVDYGIILTSYYCESRRTLSPKDALPEALRRSTSAILTSASIMIVVTFVLGQVISGAISGILTVIGVGSLTATLLVLFVLPSLLAVCDRFVVKRLKPPKPPKE